MSEGNGNGNALAKQPNAIGQLQTFLKGREKTLAQYVAGRIKPDVLIRLALLEFSQNEKLRQCKAETIYASLITAAQLGLEPGAAKGEAYLVPYGGNCQLIPGYKGLIKLALRSKAVKSIFSHVVYEMDEFAIELGSEPRVVHRPSLAEDRGSLIGAYAVAIMENGFIDVEWMPIATLEKIRAASKGANSPAYTQWPEEQYRKAPLRRICKRLPMGDDFYQAAATDEAIEAGKEPPKFDLTEAEIVAEARPSKLADKVRAKADNVIDVEDAS